jgi:hypothetical protein
MFRSLFSLILLSGSLASAQVVDGEIELAGFILGQHRRTVHAQLGPPIERRTTSEGWVYEFHKIKPDTSVYALFKYPKWDTTHIYSIQVSGEHLDDMHSFRGIKLGSKHENLDRIFGKYSSTDTVDDPPIVVQYYDHHNYSFEIDKNTGKVCGIQIYGKILERKPTSAHASIIDFKSAILSKSIDSLLVNIFPSPQFYKNEKTFTYSVAARNELKNPASDFTKLLLADSESVWQAFEVERTHSVTENRNFESTAPVTVFKFPDSKILDEIVFAQHAGRWKVSEIRFR